MSYSYPTPPASPSGAGQHFHSDATSKGVWKNDAFNVLDFGADPTGNTDSHTAIAAAITAARNTAQGVGEIYLPGGLYVCGTNLGLSGSGPNSIGIVGDGYNVSQIYFSGGGGGASMALTQCHVRDLCIRQDTNWTGITVLRGTNIENVFFYGAGGSDNTVITVTDTGAGPVWITDCTFENVKLAGGPTGIIQLSGGPTFLRGLAFHGSTATGNSTQALIGVDGGVTDFSITGCMGLSGSSSFKYGTYIATGASDRYLVNSNEFSGAATGSVHDGGSGSNKYVANNPL